MWIKTWYKYYTIDFQLQAAGLGNKEAVEYILSKYPEGTKIADNDGRTPLHWAALAKDDDEIYNMIIEHGAPEGKLDNVIWQF